MIAGQIEIGQAQSHLEQVLALYESQHFSSQSLFSVMNATVMGLGYMAWVLWQLGYPDQAVERGRQALILAQDLSPLSTASALTMTAKLHLFRRDVNTVRERSETLMRLSAEQGFPHWLALGTIMRVWTLPTQGLAEECFRHALATARERDARWGNFGPR